MRSKYISTNHKFYDKSQPIYSLNSFFHQNKSFFLLVLYGNQKHFENFFITVNIFINQIISFHFTHILQDQMDQQIDIAQQQHVPGIVQLQLEMALQPKNVKLSAQVVNKAVSYLISINTKERMPHLGFYLVKVVDNKVIGCLVLSFQSNKKWWIQSVFVNKLYRRQGHFASLFKKSIQIAKQNGVESVKLSVQSANTNAKQTYFNLGMSLIQGNYYCYDLLSSGQTFQEHKKYEFRSNYSELQNIQKWILNKQNLLNRSRTQVQSTNNLIVILRNGDITGVVRYYQQFSSWKFATIRYVEQIYLNEPQNLQQIIPDLLTQLASSSELKVLFVRFIVNQQMGNRLKGGNLQHYDILQTKLT